MLGLNWHQVLTPTLIPLAEGLSLPATSGFHRLKVMAAAENTADVIVCFDTSVRRRDGIYRIGAGDPLPQGHYLRLGPGGWEDLAVDEFLDLGHLVYGVAQDGRQDLYIMAHR